MKKEKVSVGKKTDAYTKPPDAQPADLSFQRLNNSVVESRYCDMFYISVTEALNHIDHHRQVQTINTAKAKSHKLHYLYHALHTAIKTILY